VFAPEAANEVLHYDGNAWTPQSVCGNCNLFGVWGLSATDVYATSGEPAIYHYDGNAWSQVWNGADTVTQIWGTSDANIYVAGVDPTTNAGKVLHYDGASWSYVLSGLPGQTPAVWGSSESDVFTAGVGGMILHYGGAAM